MSRQKVLDEMIATGISASKLDGAMPAIDGSAVTDVGDLTVARYSCNGQQY